MIKYDTEKTYNLFEFSNLQDEQIALAFNQLNALKNEVIEITYNACIVVGQLEGIDFDAFFNVENFTHANSFIESYLKERMNRTSKMRDLHLNLPTKRG